ncbi:hypothetical protein D3C77_294880 [compost metagenome]
MRTTARDLATGIWIAVLRIKGTDNRGGPQLQAAAFWRRGQDVRLFTHRLQLQTGPLQQPRETFLDPVLAGQTIAISAADQCRIHRQADPGKPGEAGQRGTQTAGRDLITAPLRGVVSPAL